MSEHAEIDVGFAGRQNAICCHRIGDFLIDPGPSSCVDTLLAALGDFEPRAILVTHPHIDHSGGASALAARWPRAEIWVHEQGAGLLAEPAPLRQAAGMVYGPATAELLGPVAPVAAERLVILNGGERREGFRVAHTPGHAAHHVCFLHEDSGLAFGGDVLSTRIGDGPIVPGTPPPDFDLEAWKASLELIRAWRPRALALTHFGTFGDVDEHLDAMGAALDRCVERAAVLTRDEYVAELLSSTGDHPYEFGLPVASLYAGLREHWTTRSERISSP